MKKSQFMAGIQLARQLLPTNRGVCTALKQAFNREVDHSTAEDVGIHFAETFAPFEDYYCDKNLAYFMEQAIGPDVTEDVEICSDLFADTKLRYMDERSPVVISRRLFALEMFEAQALAFELYKEW